MGSRTSSSSLGTSWCIPDTVLTPLGPVTTITLVYKSCNFIEGKTLIKLSLISTAEALVLMWWFFCRLYHKWWLLFEIPLRKDQRTPVNIFLSNQKFDKTKGLHLLLHHRTMMVAGRQHWVWVCCRESVKKNIRTLHVLYKIVSI